MILINLAWINLLIIFLDIMGTTNHECKNSPNNMFLKGVQAGLIKSTNQICVFLMEKIKVYILLTTIWQT